MIKKIGALLLVIGAFYWITQMHNTGTSSSLTSDNTILRVGTNIGYPPFMTKDADGTIQGFDFDVIQALAHHLGKKVVVSDMAFDALTIALLQGKVDVIIGGISLTPHRKAQLPFISYYGESISHVALLSSKKRFEGVKTLAEVASQGPISIVTQTGSMFEDMLHAYTSFQVKSLGEISEVVLDVVYGKSDAALLDKDAIAQIQHSYPNLHITTLQLSEEEKMYGFGIGVTPRKKLLKEELEKALYSLKEQGVMSKLEEKWFSSSSTKEVAC